MGASVSLLWKLKKLGMDSRWTPNGANEVGIDGHIELFDPSSHEALGLTARDLHLVLGPSKAGKPLPIRPPECQTFKVSEARRALRHTSR